MAIKVGFSTAACPGWDINKIVTQADEMGFYGIELATLGNERHLPHAEDLQSDEQIDAVRKLFRQHNVELVSLAGSYSLDSRRTHVRRRSFARIVENIELAGKLGCCYVRLPLGAPSSAGPANSTLARQIAPLAELARIAARHHVTLLVCNTTGFPSSRSVWFAVDGVSHAALGGAWNPLLGLSAGESSTLAVPRLGARMKMVLASNAEFDDEGRFAGYRPVGQGSVDYALTIELLKGLLFDGYLMIDGAGRSADEQSEPAEVLPAALAFLLERIKHVDPALSAYKKDKNAPNWQAAEPAFAERGGGAAKAAEAEHAGTGVQDKQGG